MLLGAELTVSVLEGPPEVPTRDGAVRAPFRAELANVFRCRPLSLPIRALDGVLNAEVQFGQYVAPVQTEHQEHLRGPSANAFDLNKVCDEIVVVHTIDGVERQCALRHFRREIAHVTNFLTRQSDRAQLLIARRQHRIGAGRVVRIERVEPRQNRRRGFSRQLLKDDRSDERLEMGPFAARFESARADDFDYSREDRVDALEVADGRAMVDHAGNLPVACALCFRVSDPFAR